MDREAERENRLTGAIGEQRSRKKEKGKRRRKEEGGKNKRRKRVSWKEEGRKRKK